MERLVGRPGETILGNCASQIASDVDDGGQLLLTLRGITQDGNEKELELPRPTAAGRAPLQIRLVPTLREDGRVESVLAVFRELSADGPVSQPSLGGDPPLVARPCGAEAAVSTDDLDGGRESVAEIQGPAADFQALIENAADIVGVIGTDGLILYESPSVERILGFRPEQMVGRPALNFVHPDDRERCAKILTAATEKTGTPRSIEYRCRHVDGSWRHLEATVQHRPRRAVGGGVVINARDVTGRREAEEELRETEEKLRESRKMEAVGRLAGGIAHDFNNLLTAIKGNTELVLMDMPDGNPGRNDLEEVLKAANRAALLTSQLLAFSRKQVLEPAILDLNAVVRSAGGMLRRLLGEDTILITALDTSLGRIEADRSQVEQILVNLAANARDAMPAGGRLVIETANADLDEEFVQSHPTAHPGRYVMISVSDTGTGMTQDVQQQIFEPFFTTKETGKGTGLGLSTVYGIVKQSGGYVWSDSEVGTGSTFRVYLPRVDDALATTDSETGGTGAEAADETVGETVLLVEDEPGVRAIARKTLLRKGYEILEAASGEEAIELSRNHPGPIQLLLTDVIMPGINGRELADLIMTERSEVRTLFMSGYTADAISRYGALEDGIAFLQKPFVPAELLRKVHSVLRLHPAP
jgi:PAS domain S-box-containing protein